MGQSLANSKRDPFKETREWKMGHSGEKRVGDWLRQQGDWYVIPSYDYSGEDNNKAPKMHGPKLALVLPDLDIAKAGERKWAEVKTKSAPNFTRKTQTMQHGFLKRHYDNYQQVQEHTGCEVWIFVLEESTNDLLCIKLDKIENTSNYRESAMEGKLHVFFDRDDMKVIANLPPRPCGPEGNGET